MSLKKFFLKPLAIKDNDPSVSNSKPVEHEIIGQKLAEVKSLENIESIPTIITSNNILTENPKDLSDNDLTKQDSLEEKYKALIEKKEEKRKKYNAYMREYMAKRKKEQKEKENKIQIQFNNVTQLYDVEEIKNLLFSYINLFVEIAKQNMDKIPENYIEEINKTFSSNHFVSYGFSIQNAVKTIL